MKKGIFIVSLNERIDRHWTLWAMQTENMALSGCPKVNKRHAASNPFYFKLSDYEF